MGFFERVFWLDCVPDPVNVIRVGDPRKVAVALSRGSSSRQMSKWVKQFTSTG